MESILLPIGLAVFFVGLGAFFALTTSIRKADGMATRFYRDYRIAEVERLARAIAIRQGKDPDGMVPETGYRDSALMPLWWRYQEDALKYIAMRDADKIPSPDQDRP